MSRIASALLAVLMLLASGLVAPAETSAEEPTLYVFWSRSCEHSQRAIRFLRAYVETEPRTRIRDFELDGSRDNVRLFSRLLDRLGAGEEFALVPFAIVGLHITVGFEPDGSTGRRITQTLEQCRASPCPDVVADLLPAPPTERTALAHKVGCQQDGRAGRAIRGE